MSSNGKPDARGGEPARHLWGSIIAVVGLVLVASSAVSFVMAQADDDGNTLLEAIYLLLLGMGAIAYGESKARSTSDET